LGYHDVPWDAPALVSDCIRKSQAQRAWYRKQDLSAVPSPSVPLTARSERRAVELDCEAK
jgi:hypothetical protein